MFLPFNTPLEIVPLSQKFVSRNWPVNAVSCCLISMMPWNSPWSQVACHSHLPLRISAVSARAGTQTDRLHDAMRKPDEMPKRLLDLICLPPDSAFCDPDNSR